MSIGGNISKPFVDSFLSIFGTKTVCTCAANAGLVAIVSTAIDTATMSQIAQL